MSGTKLLSYWHQIKHPFGASVAWLGTTIGLIAAAIQIFEALITTHSARELIYAMALTAIALSSAVTLAWREFDRLDHMRLARSLPYMGDVSIKLRDIRSFLNSKARAGATADSNEFRSRIRKMITDVLTDYAKMFSMMTASPCRMCVKLISAEPSTQGGAVGPNDLYVYALARDEASERANLNHDKERAETKNDMLQHNSDFLMLWDERRDDLGYFFSNDLRADPGYESSSMSYWRGLRGKQRRFDKDSYPLSYRSTIVWPIRQDRREDLGIDHYRAVGFLAVDSPRAGAFNEVLHSSFGAILAHALYPILEIYNELASVEVGRPLDANKEAKGTADA